MADDNGGKPASDGAAAGSLFGPIWEVYARARDVHPFVPYAIVVLFLVVVAAFMVKYVSPYAGDIGAIRTILYLFLIVFFLMAFFATFADFIVPSSSKTSWSTRLARIVIVATMGAAGFFGAYQVANATPANCGWVAVLAGAKVAESCKVVPGGRTPVIRGIVTVNDDAFATIEGARASILIDMHRTPVPIPSTGEFTLAVASDLVGKVAEVSVQIPSVAKPLRMSKTIEAGGAAFAFNVDLQSLAPTVRISRPAAAAVAPEIAGKVADAATIKTAWFDGQDLQFTLFYCQAPDGDGVASKILAAQLQSVLKQQTNVGAIELRAWPASTTPGYSNIARGAVLLNQPTNGMRDTVVAELQRLWSPFLPDGVTARPRFVATAYAKMTAVICI